jgi:hypothetical protein
MTTIVARVEIDREHRVALWVQIGAETDDIKEA